MPEAGLFFAACERFAADIYWMSYELVSVRVPSVKPAEPDRQVVHCRHCRSMADLLVRMVDPKDGRILSVFRASCEKLTTNSDNPPHTQPTIDEQDSATRSNRQKRPSQKDEVRWA